MKILYITAYPLEYDSSSNVRNMSLIKGMHANGHSISTLSPYPTDLKSFTGKLLDFPFENRYWIGSKKIANQNAKTNKPSPVKKWLVDIYAKFSIYDRRKWLAKFITNNLISQSFDIIISSSDPKSAHMLAEQLIKLNRGICKKWIQYWGDPLTNDITVKRLIPEFIVRKEEYRILSKADKIIYVSPLTSLLEKSMHKSLESKIYFYPVPLRDATSSALFNPNNKLVSHIGNYYSNIRNIKPFVEAINDLKIPAAIVGNSDVKIKSSQYLTVKDRIMGKEFEDIKSKTGIIVCICNLHGTQIPGKIYHDVNSGKPILIILDGEYKEQLRSYFSSFNRYYMCDNEKDAIKRSIIEILNNYKYFQTPEQLKPEYIAKYFLTL